jgi:hypothetical protein
MLVSTSAGSELNTDMIQAGGRSNVVVHARTTFEFALEFNP